MDEVIVETQANPVVDVAVKVGKLVFVGLTAFITVRLASDNYDATVGKLAAAKTEVLSVEG